MAFHVWHLDDSKLFGLHDASTLPPRYYDAKMGFKDNGSQERACAELFAQGLYKLAARVESSDMDDAWQLTNHIDRSWTENVGVAPSAGPQRSSSVGDLLENLEDGSFHVVASIGFKPVLGIASPPSPPRKAAKP